MTRLYDHAVAFLKAQFTADLDNRDKLAAAGWVPSGWKREEVIGVVNLARFVGEPTILPAALLGCMALGSGLVPGFVREDGVTERLSNEDLGICVAASATGRILAASASARIRLAARIGSCKMPRPQAGRNYAPGYGPQGSDPNTRIIKMAEKLVGVVDPLAKISDLLETDEIHHCPECFKVTEEWDASERRRLWNRLPELLGVEVPGWDDSTKVVEKPAGSRTSMAEW
ncbi:hypothetical protein K466DRAFT_86287 [Polyporus arcularius HHB13444]|uniref:Uncharacterized protein n=1 Tax=Polyporus arcularius HHB13444 TaxID=1314778 RepID=A0A5C3PFV2_9APHY|nr:hypothetical protein K466DRAFT_86287 [Polyporus arcularius HHB13444]